MRKIGWVLAVTCLSCLLPVSWAQQVAPDQRSKVEKGSPLPLDKSAQAMTLPDGLEPAMLLLAPPASVAESESSLATGGVFWMTLMVKVCWLCSVPVRRCRYLSRLPTSSPTRCSWTA